MDLPAGVRQAPPGAVPIEKLPRRSRQPAEPQVNAAVVVDPQVSRGPGKVGDRKLDAPLPGKGPPHPPRRDRLDQGRVVEGLSRVREPAVERAVRPDSALDRRLAYAGEALYNSALIEAISTGRMWWSFPGEGRVEFAIPDLPRAAGYLGVNYYSRVHLRFRGLPGAAGEFFYRDRAGRGLTDTGWEIHPQGFDRGLGSDRKSVV